MKILGICVALFSVMAALVSWRTGDHTLYLLAGFGLLAASTTYLSSRISTFLQILIRFFSFEVLVLGACVCVDALGAWPESLDFVRIPSSVAITVALFSFALYLVSFIPIVAATLSIADRYFNALDTLRIPLGFGRAITIDERHYAAATIMFIVLLNQLEVFFQVMISYINRAIFNSFQTYNASEFWQQLLLFPVYLAPFLIALFIETLVGNTLVIRWRRWLTEDYERRWLDRHNHYHMMLAGVGTDNPDQRISEDVSRFIDGQFGGQSGGGLGLYNFSINLISTLSTLVSYSIILWSQSALLTFPGTSFKIPGLLLWAAILFAILGTGGASLIARRLIPLAFSRQHFEANFRFALARLREYGEQIALMAGERTEIGILKRRFVSIMRNFYSIMFVKAFFAVFQNLFNNLSNIFPLVLMAPFFFAKKVTLGDLTLTMDAFANVNSSLTFFITYYTSLADFQSVLNRLTTFDASLDHGAPSDRLSRNETGANAIILSRVEIAMPDGSKLTLPLDLRFEGDHNTLIAGPSGAGKSTLFRVIAGVWPFGSGAIDLPAEDAIMVLPQKPYLPVGTLAAAVCYPSPSGTYAPDDIQAALADVQLPKFVDQLELDENWTQRLSGGEQQRLAIARAILRKPKWLLLDEATASMDPALEAAIHVMLARRLPDTTIVSIAHRAGLADHHDRLLDMAPGAAGLAAVTERTPAAE